MNTPAYSLDPEQFRLQFLEFNNAATYPNPTLQFYYDTAGLYIENTQYGFLARAGATQHSLYLMMAHLLKLGKTISEGGQPGITISATIDKISTAMQQVALKNQWQYWLASTPYGAQLLTLLQVQSVGGFYTPGGAGRAGFRW